MDLKWAQAHDGLGQLLGYKGTEKFTYFEGVVNGIFGVVYTYPGSVVLKA